MSGPAGIPPVRRSTLGDAVHEALKALILDHRLAPRQRVNIDALARQLGVSPTPVREALARLESEGLLDKRPQAGYRVSPLLTRAQFTDMFDMRVVLEGAAARWAAARVGTEECAAIVAAAEDEYLVDAPTANGRRSHTSFTTLDAHFHDLVAAAAGNPLLRQSITRLHAHLHLHRLYFPYAETASTGREHRQIAAAIHRGDPEAAQAAMCAHLDAARTRHLAAFD